MSADRCRKGLITVAEDSVGMLKELEVFPIYRRLRGGQHLYRISASDRFEELQRIGARWVLHRVQATAYPELLRIHEMRSETGPFECSDEAEWAAALVDVEGGSA